MICTSEHKIRTSGEILFERKNEVVNQQFSSNSECLISLEVEKCEPHKLM
jgi:hypothetical protein